MNHLRAVMTTKERAIIARQTSIERTMFRGSVWVDHPKNYTFLIIAWTAAYRESYLELPTVKTTCLTLEEAAIERRQAAIEPRSHRE
jgi:hypothetical protein